MKVRVPSGADKEEARLRLDLLHPLLRSGSLQGERLLPRIILGVSHLPAASLDGLEGGLPDPSVPGGAGGAVLLGRAVLYRGKGILGEDGDVPSPHSRSRL